MVDPGTTFKQGLGTRIDALEVAVKAIDAKESDADSTLRQLAQSLLTAAARHGFDNIMHAAQALVQSPDSDLPNQARKLIEVLREEAARARRWKTSILVIGGQSDFNAELQRELAALERDVCFAATAAEAQATLREKVVVCIVLNLFLPDLDGRTMLIRLRENPLTASIPVLMLAEKISDDAREDSLFLSVEAFIEHPVTAADVASKIRARLRRSHETMKEAHRDPLTGLLNRAACRRQFARIQEACRASQEPVSFAIMAVDGARAILDEHGTETSEAVVRRIASLLSSSLRATDILARWGIYEYAAVFPGEDQFGGTRAVEKVKEALRNLMFEAPDGSSFRVTLSAGVALSPDTGSIDATIADADRYLFQAQSTGGNRVVSNQSRITRRRERILLALDDSVTARVLTHLFEREGFDVAHAETADAAVATAAGRQRFHLIVVAEELPPGNGFEALQELRGMPRNNRVPIVMLISRNSPKSIVRALELGANDYVIMPFSPLTFMTHMRRLLTRGAMVDPGHGRFLRVLVADDETRPLLLAASALHERGGFSIFLAKGAQDAQDRFAAENPDAVILPARLEETPGTLLFDALRVTNQGLNTMFVLTAPATDHTARKAPPEGAVGVLTKPFNPLKLAEDLEHMLRVPANSRRPPHATEQLNSEIQRIVRMP